MSDLSDFFWLVWPAALLILTALGVAIGSAVLRDDDEPLGAPSLSGDNERHLRY
jgi:hypothetical protein